MALMGLRKMSTSPRKQMRRISSVFWRSSPYRRKRREYKSQRYTRRSGVSSSLTHQSISRELQAPANQHILESWGTERGHPQLVYPWQVPTKLIQGMSSERLWMVSNKILCHLTQIFNKTPWISISRLNRAANFFRRVNLSHSVAALIFTFCI